MKSTGNLDRHFHGGFEKVMRDPEVVDAVEVDAQIVPLLENAHVRVLLSLQRELSVPDRTADALVAKHSRTFTCLMVMGVLRWVYCKNPLVFYVHTRVLGSYLRS